MNVLNISSSVRFAFSKTRSVLRKAGMLPMLNNPNDSNDPNDYYFYLSEDPSCEELENGISF